MLYSFAHGDTNFAWAKESGVTGSIPAEWIAGVGLNSLEVLALFNNSLQGAML